MDEETQPKVLSNLTVKPTSNSSLDSFDTKPGSYMLPKVVDIANQVSVEIRQNHPLCFSQLPIVVIQRYEPDEHTSVNDSTLSNILPNTSSEIKNMEDSQENFKQNKTIDHDESSIVPNEPSVILPNNDSNNCLKRSSSNESLNNDKTKKCRFTVNLIEEQFETDELSNVSNELYSNSILPNNDSTNYTEETQQNRLSDSDKMPNNVEVENHSDSNTTVIEGVNVDMDANNIKVKEEIPDFTNGYKKNFKKAPGDILALKKSVKYCYSKSIEKRIKNEVNEEVEMKDGFVSNKIVELDHHYYKSLSPENSPHEEKINEVTQPTEKIDLIQTDNMNDLTSIEQELINVECNNSNDLQESIINDPLNSQSSMKNDLVDQIVECTSVDATNDIPTPVTGECLQNIVCDNEEVDKMCGIFQFYDDERWEEFSNDLNIAQEYILTKLFSTFERSDLTFTEMEKLVSKEIDEIMRSRFDKYFQRKNEECIKKNEQIWRDKYIKLVQCLREIKALVKKHEQELEADKNAAPRKLRRHIKTQTKRPKNMSIVPQQQQSVVAMHFTVDANGVVSDSSNPEKKCSKSMEKSTQNTTSVTSTLTPSNNTLNLVSVPPNGSSSSSSFIVQSASNTGLLQTITDSRIHNFTTNFGNQHCKPVYVVSSGNYFPVKLAPVITSIAVPEENTGTGPRIKEYFSLQPVQLPPDNPFLPPVPPAIPIDDNLPILHRAQNQLTISPLQQLLQAPTKRSLDKNTPKVRTSRKKNASTLNQSFETVNLVSPEPPEESEIYKTATSSNIENQKSVILKRKLLPALAPKISGVRILKDAHELGDKTNTPPIEIFNLVSPEPSEELYINVPSTSSEITNQKRLRASTQPSSVPHILLKKGPKVKVHKKEATNLNSHFEVVSLLSPERPDESEINDSVISSGITNQKDLCASTQQPSVPAHESLKTPEMAIHDNYDETPDEFPFETIDLSSPEFSEEPEINDQATSSGITNQKPNSAKTIQTLVPSQLIETSKVAEEIAYGNCVKTPDKEPNEIINLSSPEFSNDTEMNEPGPSSGITDQSYILAKVEPSVPIQRKETSKVAASVTHENSVKISNILPTGCLNLPDEEMCPELKDHRDPATLKQSSLPSWKPIPTLILKNICEKQTSEELILKWYMDITSNSAEVKKFEVFCRRVISEIPTNDDNWVKIGEGDYKPLPIACIFKKQSRNGKCQFSIRVVDEYNRVSPFCSSGAILID